MRYTLNKFGIKHTFIRDLTGRAIAYGPSFEYAEFAGSHRSSYAPADVQAVADWLNERAEGYPSGPPLLVRLP